jgi:hypothetical protein
MAPAILTTGNLYFPKLPRYIFYILPVHFIFPDVPNMRRRRRALNAAANRASRRTAGALP